MPVSVNGLWNTLYLLPVFELSERHGLKQIQQTWSQLLDGGILAAILIVILLMNVVRFLGLDNSPPGFHVDELSGAVTVQCLEQEGIDALDNPYPLFADLNYGSPKPPTYIYPAILWTKIFGHSISSYRAFSAFIAFAGILGVFFLAWELLGLKVAVWSVLFASVSPTVFQVSRIALEAGLAPLFILWGTYLCIRFRNYAAAAMAGACFAAAMYSYPPARLFVPVYVVALLIVRWLQGQRHYQHIIVMLVALSVVNVPLVQGTLSGEYMGRFHKIGILSEDFLRQQGKGRNIPDVAAVFLDNYRQHLSPGFLFREGDQNYVYSTGRFGLLSWVDTVALVLALALFVGVAASAGYRARVLRKGEGWTIALLGTAIMLSIVPAALTWQDIPHSLRMILYWPFLAILNGLVLARMSVGMRWLPVPVLGLVFAFVYIYLNHYFKVYPERSYYMYSTYTKEEVARAKTREDWMKFLYRYRRQNFHTRYYLMNFLEGQTCSSSQVAWKEVHKIP